MRCLSLNGFAGDRTPYAMYYCHQLSEKVSEYFGIAVEYHGEAQNTKEQNWDVALVESQPLFQKAAVCLNTVLNQLSIPLIITPRCATAIATLPQVMSSYPDCIDLL